MSKENTLSKIIARSLRNNFVKGLAIGISAAVVIGIVVGVSIHYGTPKVPEPNGNGNGNEPEVPFSTNLAQEIQSVIPDVVHVELIGNGTSSIHPNLISAEMNRLGDNITYSWNVSAFSIALLDYVIFEFSQNEVNQIAQGLFDSINNTERVGTYGEDPYPGTGDFADLKWVTEIYLENHTAIFLYINQDGLILYQSTEWTGDFSVVHNLIGADVLIPESAFDDYVQVLHNLFTPHMET
ncbi:MAG: hypothetical protein H7641_01140 [Candidatus Heimdallarchaeota archaeon]|nr:hypothetical protein [Candidatus Heimdallarchaeota archaeon]MCK4876172.1 hypothetical protein [Candidatus Heimdallarchaeota archaeon]